MKYDLKYLALLLLLLHGSHDLLAQEPRQLSWADLVPEHKLTDNPFEKLTAGQLHDLFIVDRVRKLEEQEPESVSETMLHEKDSLEGVLAGQNMPVDSLFKAKDEADERRRKEAEAVVEELSEIQVRMPGYLLPLDYSGGLVREFLLVPWVGACIHTPPPPRNQIVYINLDEGFEVGSVFEAVWVEGLMKTETYFSELYLVDGSDKIQSGYVIQANKIERFSR